MVLLWVLSLYILLLVLVTNLANSQVDLTNLFEKFLPNILPKSISSFCAINRL